MVKGTTSGGFAFEYDEQRLDDMRFVDVLAVVIDDGAPFFDKVRGASQLLTMLLGGVASGVGVFVMNAWVAPEYYAELMNNQIDTVLLQGRADDATIELMEKMRPSILHFMKNPFVWIVSSSCNLLFYGGLAGLVMASSLRQKEQTPSNNE